MASPAKTILTDSAAVTGSFAIATLMDTAAATVLLVKVTSTAPFVRAFHTEFLKILEPLNDHNIVTHERASDFVLRIQHMRTAAFTWVAVAMKF
jgi:hypothetical protein